MKPKKQKSEDVKSKEIEQEDVQEVSVTIDGGELTAEVAPVQPKKAAEQNLMYIGPTIPNLIRHGIVYADGKLPQKIEDAITSYKPMRQLFVTIDEIPSAVKEIKLKTGALAIIYKNVAQRIRG
jgi:hypothetical protein